jgi:hypothetical protein
MGTQIEIKKTVFQLNIYLTLTLIQNLMCKTQDANKVHKGR